MELSILCVYYVVCMRILHTYCIAKKNYVTRATNIHTMPHQWRVCMTSRGAVFPGRSIIVSVGRLPRN